MSRRPLNAEGGRAERFQFSAPSEWIERVDLLAETRKVSRSEYLRILLERVIEDDELVTKEASRAS
jgi:metal-responsive CopG/Arc/MetJ family transcriptional regulator